MTNISIVKADRSASIERILASLTSLRGVTAAAIIDSDGFVKHVRMDFELSTDALGAAIQVMFGSARRAAEQLAQGRTKLVPSESTEGILLLAPIAKGFVLVVVADSSVLLGSVRFELKETRPELAHLF